MPNSPQSSLFGRYFLKTRRLTEAEAVSSRSFLLEEDEEEMYLNAFAEDIQALDDVEVVTRNGFDIIIKLADQLSITEFKQLLKPLFSQHAYLSVIRYVSAKGI